jgi:small acid-soluble spore protein I (minor)
MNTDIRSYIRSNFRGTSADEIRASIEESIEKKDEVTLPGLGVLLEIIWSACSDEEKERLLDILSSQFK